MPEEKKPTRSELINLWVQTIGIVAAGIWAAYVFVYKEITAPKAVPVNVSVELSADRVGPTHLARSPAGSEQIAVRVRVVARNPSTREVQLLPSMLVVYGDILDPQDLPFTSPQQMRSFGDYSGAIAERFVKRAAHEVVTFGNPLPDQVLEPGEVVSRTLVLHLPPGKYDRLEAFVITPSARKTDGLKVQYSVNAKDQIVDVDLQELKKGKWVPVERGDDGQYNSPGRELQESIVRFQLSLGASEKAQP